jgi:hypothetical protein
MDAGTGAVDAGVTAMDAGTGAVDAGVTAMDAGTGVTDAGAGAMDAGAPEVDAGTMDAGAGTMDAGVPEMDAGEADAGEPDAGAADAGTHSDAGSGTRDAGEADAGTGHSCTANANCSEPTPVCDTVTETCVQCLHTTDCLAGEVCSSNACTAPTACTTSTDCSGSNPYCNPVTGYCVECDASTQCSAGESCYGGICVVPTTCTHDASCPTGDVCEPLNTTNYSGWKDQCLPDNPSGALGGAPCSSNAQCLSGNCLLIYSPNATDGFCLDVCNSASSCATGAQCPPQGVVFELLPQSNGVYDNSGRNEVGADQEVCTPEVCALDSQCATAGAGGVARTCSLISGKVNSTNAYSQTVESYVEACMPTQGTTGGGLTCTQSSDCASGFCINWGFVQECFGACEKDSDCPQNDICTDTGAVDESGKSIYSCY